MVLSFVVGLVVGGLATHLMSGLPVVDAVINTVMVPVKWAVGAVDSAWTAVKGLFSK
jgi:hypothetical protein